MPWGSSPSECPGFAFFQEVLERIRVYVQGDLPDYEEPTPEQVEWATRIKDRWLKLR